MAVTSVEEAEDDHSEVTTKVDLPDHRSRWIICCQSQMTPPRDCDITEPSLREDVSRIERRLEDAPTRQILVVEGTHDGAAVSSLGIRQTRV
jgi:hypothetical protein